ncbi:hypothetical protein [Thiolapillus sp.]|uniref:hypothetical protein n=2 Tax=Thiolapillus sp. TaxID=2017437 RepID=UPI003AF4FC64
MFSLWRKARRENSAASRLLGSTSLRFALHGWQRKSVRWVGNEAAPELEVEVAERANGKPVCSGCGHHRPGYDRLAKRRFEFVPLWGIKVFLVYAPCRVECPSCGIRVEQMPWAMGKRPLTRAYGWFLASWARRLSWKETAEVFRTSWESVFRSVEMAQACLRPRDRFWNIPVPKIDSAFDNLFVPQPSWSPSTAQQLRKLVAAPYLAPI